MDHLCTTFRSDRASPPPPRCHDCVFWLGAGLLSILVWVGGGCMPIWRGPDCPVQHDMWEGMIVHSREDQYPKGGGCLFQLGWMDG